MAEKAGHARQRTVKPLDIDEGLMALFIGAMHANRHVAREELARAHHLIWSTRRFRRKSGETVGRLIDRAQRRLEADDAARVLDVAARAIPARLRPSVLAMVADLLLADGKIDAAERRFLQRLAANFKIRTQAAADIVEVILTKNHL
jgi:tellurite resistance protein